MQVPSVYNLESPRTGKPVANQFVITTRNNNQDVQVFQSYAATIAIMDLKAGSLTVDPEYWDYSLTTLKYFKQFAGLTRYSKSEIAKMIEAGKINEYTPVFTKDLN